MTRRSASVATLRHADEWSTRWQCRCGYENAGRSRCLMCGAKAPAEAQDTPGLSADEDGDGQPGDRTPTAKAGRKATRTVVKLILANLLLTGFEIFFFAATGTPPARAIAISFVIGIMFYAICATWVNLRSFDLGLRARWGKDTARAGVLEGFIVGASAAVLVTAVLRLALGRAELDPTTALLASSSVFMLVLGAVLIVVAAPLVEELVFRGFLLEAFRRKGKGAAVALSAVAFSLAHLSLAQFRYYFWAGVLLGLVYWRRGLVGSIAAHATFNGMLVVCALAAFHGPTTDVEFAGARVAVPAIYAVAEVFGDDLALVGPGGQTIEFAHMDVTEAPPASDIGATLVRGGPSLPALEAMDVIIDTTSVSLIDLPAGRAVSAVADVHGLPGRMVVLPTEGRIWVAVFRSDGSFRSTQDFDAM
ncbi:MAG: lysostaphin resistance A-like protein, partial [Acidimicrobiales bacterium]